MKYLNFLLLAACIMVYACSGTVNNTDPSDVEPAEVESTEVISEEPTYTSDEQMQLFFDEEYSDQQVFIHGEVVKNLPDDNEGSRHQKFILELASGQTVLVSHNIDLADRIKGLNEGDQVKVFGEYEWNNRGGVVHWTHHDPKGYHVGGWIEHNNTFYE